VWARLQAHWRAKLLLTITLNVIFWAGYSVLGHWPLFPVRVPLTTWLDRAIPYQPEPWAWVYLSQFLLVSLLPWMLDTAKGLRRYVGGVAFLCGVSFTLFLLFPVASPRPPMGATTGAMHWILAYDGAFNAFPSLHAGFLAYLTALGWRLFCHRLPPAFMAAAMLWAALILYATIATRQHYAVDLVAGAIIGYVADRLAWRSSSGVSAAPAMARSRGVESQSGWK